MLRRVTELLLEFSPSAYLTDAQLSRLTRIPVFTTLADDPMPLANTVRNLLGITYKDQVGWHNDYEAFSHWRSAFERIGVLVCQATGIPVEEMRGFSVSDTPLPMVVVNSKDAVRGRIFTLLHEFGHVLLRKGGVCDLDEDALRPPEEQHIEIFCNRLAGEILVPTTYLLQEESVVAKGPNSEWSKEEIAALAQRYHVSREALLRRLLICGFTTEDFYQRQREVFQQAYQSQRQTQRAGYVPPHRKVISNAGRFFVRLVLHGYYQEKLTASDLSDYLEVRLKHLEPLEQEVIGHSVVSGALA